jgi:hypothetical protein
MKLGFALNPLTISSLLCVSTCLVSGQVFYGDPPDDHHPWAIHDQNRPKPPVVTPGTFSSQEQPGKPPSDAIILFDGSGLSKWQSAKEGRGPAKWIVKDGYMEAAPSTGDIMTVEEFGDCQLHVEWAAPTDIKGASQGRGNSGIFLMGMCEVQVLDNYNNPTYADGYAGSVYGINPPMVNPLRPPGQFQVYDIVFRRPIFREGRMVDPGYLTVFINGVLVQDHTPLEGPGGHMRRSKPTPFPEKGSLKLQDHGNPVQFRNIWYRKLPPRSIEGGTDGFLTTEATMAKRKAIAADIRQDAARLQNDSNPIPYMLRLFESLMYEKDPAAQNQAEQIARDFVQRIKALSSDQLNAKKDEIRNLNSAFGYLAKNNLLSPGFTPQNDTAAIIKQQRWDKK